MIRARRVSEAPEPCRSCFDTGMVSDAIPISTPTRHGAPDRPRPRDALKNATERELARGSGDCFALGTGLALEPIGKRCETASEIARAAAR